MSNMGKTFSGLNGLRGVCAFLVVLFHVTNFLIRQSCGHAYLSVDIFFILSGFVIALNYEKRISNGLPFSQFIRLRITRLIPIYWIGCFCCLCVFMLWVPTVISRNISAEDYALIIISVLPTFLFIPRFTDRISSEFLMNGPAWSLFSEWIANILYALFLFQLSAKKLLQAAILIYLAALISGYFAPYAWMHIGILRFGVSRAIAGFCIGVCIYRCHTHPNFQRLPDINPNIILLAWCGVVMLPVFPENATIDTAILMVVCPIIVTLLIRSEARAPRWCGLAGRLSYPLYASHMAIIMLVQMYLKKPNWGVGIATILAAIALAAAIAWANDRIQERIRRPVPDALPSPAQ